MFGPNCVPRKMTSQKICSRHFLLAEYSDIRIFKLKHNAMPSVRPACVSTCTDILEVSVAQGSSAKAEVGEQLETSTTSLASVDDAPSTSSNFIEKKNATTREICLGKIIKRKEKHIAQLKATCKKHCATIKDVTKLNVNNSEIFDKIFEGLSESAKIFMIGQLKAAKHPPKGRRWTIDEKALSLMLYKASPHTYSLLRKIVPMPGKSTLDSLLRNVKFEPGINPQLFAHLANCVKHDMDKKCVLTFDEMSLREHLQLCKSSGSISGVVDLGNGRRTTEIENHALVFLIQGVRRSWKQPVAYYFTRSSVRADVLKTLIQDVLTALSDVGFDVVATICDMAANNRKAIQLLGATEEEPVYNNSGKDIVHLYDFPHLLKCTRNMFFKHGVRLPVLVGEHETVMDAKWEHVQAAYEIDKNKPGIFRTLPKLTDDHLNPKLQTAMRVNIAAQVMSRSVAAFLHTLISFGTLTESLGTAHFISQVNTVFDSVNGRIYAADIGELGFQHIIHNKSGHIEFWRKARDQISHWSFNTSRKSSYRPPSQVGWLQSLRGMEIIWHNLKCSLNYLRPRTFNQDGLENMFGAIRHQLGKNEHPTVEQFEGALKSQILHNFTKNNTSRGRGNCEMDDQELLSDLKGFLQIRSMDENEEDIEQDIECDEYDYSIHSVTHGAIESLSVAYVSGYIAKRCLAKIDCKTCRSCLTTDQDVPSNTFIAYKEFSAEKNLIYPNENLTIFVGQAITVIEKNIKLKMHLPDLTNFFIAQLQRQLNANFIHCEIHKETLTSSILLGVCRIGIPFYCKQVVRNIKSNTNVKRKLSKLS